MERHAEGVAAERIVSGAAGVVDVVAHFDGEVERLFIPLEAGDRREIGGRPVITGSSRELVFAEQRDGILRRRTGWRGTPDSMTILLRRNERAQTHAMHRRRRWSGGAGYGTVGKTVYEERYVVPLFAR